MKEARVEMSPAKLAVVRSFSIFINSTVTATRSVAGALESELFWLPWSLVVTGFCVSELFAFAESELAVGLDFSERLQSDSIAIKKKTAMIEFIWRQSIRPRFPS